MVHLFMHLSISQASKWTKSVGAENRGRVSDCPCDGAFRGRLRGGPFAGDQGAEPPEAVAFLAIKSTFSSQFPWHLDPYPPYGIFFSQLIYTDLKNDQNWSARGWIQPMGWKFGGLNVYFYDFISAREMVKSDNVIQSRKPELHSSLTYLWWQWFWSDRILSLQLFCSHGAQAAPRRLKFCSGVQAPAPHKVIYFFSWKSGFARYNSR